MFDEYPVINSISTKHIYNTQKFTFTTDTNTKYIVLYNSADNQNIIVNNLDLEEGITLSSYTPHQEKIYNFPLSEGQKLMQDGTIENKVVNPRKQVVLDGVTDDKKVSGVALYSSNGLYYCICSNAIIGGKPIPIGANVENLVCSHFQPAIGVAINHCYRTAGGSTFVFVLTDQTITTAEQANAWLAEQYANGTPVIVEYPLAIPDETEFTEEQKSVIDEIIRDGTYDEVTHFTAEASINPDMEIGYYKDLEIWVNNLLNS